MLFVISLPAWAKKPPKEICEDNDKNEAKENCIPAVPDGGASYLYVILSGLAISGGILIKSKRGTSTVYPPEV
jgi:hypothetical protein